MIYKGEGQVKEAGRDNKTPGTFISGTNNSRMPLSTLGLTGQGQRSNHQNTVRTVGGGEGQLCRAVTIGGGMQTLPNQGWEGGIYRNQ